MKPARWILAVVACLTAQASSAQILTATIDGTILANDNGDAYDLAIFSDGYQVLTGQAFHAVLTFDLSQSPLHDAHYSGALSDVEQLAGGAWASAPTFGRATLSIAGHSVSANGISIGYVTAGSGERDFAVEDWSDPESGYFELVANFFDPANGFPTSLAGAGSWNGTYDYDLDAVSALPSQFIVSDGQGISTGRLAPTSLSVTISVPEPASWTMMVAGLGLVGAGLRTRRQWEASSRLA